MRVHTVTGAVTTMDGRPTMGQRDPRREQPKRPFREILKEVFDEVDKKYKKEKR